MREELVQLVGENYRSRISNYRIDLGMVIENVPQYVVIGGKRRRSYGACRYRPGALGREAGDFVKGDVTSGSLFPPEHLSGWQETR